MSLHLPGSNGARFAALLASVALIAAACGGGAATSAPSAAAESEAPASQAASEAPSEAASPAAEKFKIGYISLGDNVPFVKLVSDGIKKAAADAGQDLAFCDSQVDQAKALECAQNLKVQGVQGVLNFQVFQDSSPEICEAYGGVPTIAIDIVQPPCQIAFMGANNREAGRLGGAAMGQYAKDNWNCEYTAYVSLESTAAGAANTDRMGGYRDGFQEFCPIVKEKERVLDGADRTDPALEQMTNLLGALPGDKIVVVAINEDGILGAIGAANTLGRQKDLYYSGQGTDPSIWKDVACNPNYIASVAYFPEKYGELLIPNMVKALQGETIPENIFTEHQVVTKDNIRTIYPETPAC
ncbi:MAG TPA: sugar ABC transporter substrate-binding protein [Candidatus Limnocylindrales bacterium]|nr:sugar ABC transporter substrate-binding protein [Candidatus Limnocylindrales bacterium]